MSEIFESKPRWPDAPKVCIAENRMSFSSGSEIKKFIERYCPSHTITKQWDCKVCSMIHFEAEHVSPNGALGQYPKGWKLKPQPAPLKEKAELRFQQSKPAKPNGGPKTKSSKLSQSQFL